MSLDLSSTILDLIKSVNDVTETFVSRNGSSMYGSLSPYNNKGASLGTSSKQWNTIYGGTIYENGTSLSNKYGVTVTPTLTTGTEIASIKVGSTTTKLYAPTGSGSVSGNYLPLSGGTLTGNVLLSNSNAQGSQPNLKWKTINSKTPYVGYCTASADGTFLVASLTGTSYTTGLSIGGSSGNLLWKGTRVATTSDIPSLSNYSTLANTIKSLSASGTTITYTKGDGTKGTITTQDTKVTQKGTSASSPCSLALLSNNNGSEVTDYVYKNIGIFAIPYMGAIAAKMFVENNTPLSEKYQPKKRKVTLAELRAAMPTMTTGTRIQVVPHGADYALLYGVGACVPFSAEGYSFYNSQTESYYDHAGSIYYQCWVLEIDDGLAEARGLSYHTDGSQLEIDDERTETFTDEDTDFYILD